MIPEWVRKLTEAAKPHVPADFAGTVEILVSTSGEISTVTVKQSWERSKAGAA